MGFSGLNKSPPVRPVRSSHQLNSNSLTPFSEKGVTSPARPSRPSEKKKKNQTMDLIVSVSFARCFVEHSSFLPGLRGCADVLTGGGSEMMETDDSGWL